MNILILIPAYNEKGNLAKLISEIEQEFKKQKVKFKIFFVIQGDDGSKQLLDKLKQKKSYLDFIYYKKPLGIGKAYKIGYNHIDKSVTYVLTMDADLNHDIRDLPRFLKSIKEANSDLIIGSRFIKGGQFEDTRLWKKAASLATNKIVTAFLGLPLKDVSSGFRLIKAEVIKQIRNRLKCPGYPSYMEFVLLAHKNGFKVREIPITYHPRKWGRSKISSATTFIDYIRFLIDILI